MHENPSAIIVSSRPLCRELQQSGQVTHHRAEPRRVIQERMGCGEVEFCAISHGDAIPLGAGGPRWDGGHCAVAHQAWSKECWPEPLGDLSFQRAFAERFACGGDGIECFSSVLRQTRGQQFNQVTILPR